VFVTKFIYNLAWQGKGAMPGRSTTLHTNIRLG
jgi:hypothetical protein